MKEEEMIREKSRVREKKKPINKTSKKLKHAQIASCGHRFPKSVDFFRLSTGAPSSLSDKWFQLV